MQQDVNMPAHASLRPHRLHACMFTLRERERERERERVRERESERERERERASAAVTASTARMCMHAHTTGFNTDWVKGRIFCVGDRWKGHVYICI